MNNKGQLRVVAGECSQYRFNGQTGMQSEARVAGDTVKSCENCNHFTAKHTCELNLIDKISSNLDVKLDG